MKTYKFHPVALEFPRMPKAEYDELKEDIREHGIRIPILINKKKDTILDGRNRMIAACALKLKDSEVPVEVFTGTDEEAVAAIVSRNIMRRNLTDDQRATLLAKLVASQFAADGKKRMSEGGKGLLNSPNLHAHVRLAKAAKVSQHKARAALDVAKHAPGVADRVIQAKMRLAEAAKVARAKAGKTAKPKPVKSLRERVEAKFLKFMESFAVTDYRSVREILRELLENAEK
jgi:ParB-like chromosome segregation protein Spo0J